jgi:ELWxxDGT repeat protein
VWPAAGGTIDSAAPEGLVAVSFGLIGTIRNPLAHSQGDFFVLPIPGQLVHRTDWPQLGSFTAIDLPDGSTFLATFYEGVQVLRGPNHIERLPLPADDPQPRIRPIKFRGTAAWVAGGWLWRSDGHEAGTGPELPVGGIEGVRGLGQNLLLLDRDGVSVTDGTAAGTRTLLTADKPSLVVTSGNRALLATSSGWLWLTDGAPETTVPLARVSTNGPAADLGQRAVFLGRRFSSRHSALFSWDGSRNTGLTKVSDDINEVVAANGWAVFANSSDRTGRELWITDGTPTGTRQLADLWPGFAGSEPAGFVRVAGGVVFTAQHPAHGREVWFTDGSTAGTRLVADIRPGPESSLPEGLIYRSEHLFVIATDGVQGREIWRLRLDGNPCD